MTLDLTARHGQQQADRGGWMGWEAKSKGVEWRPCQADKEELGFQGRTVFKVSSM